MTRSVSLETASSVALIARQLGAVVSNEQIGEEYTSGGCRDEVALTDYFSRLLQWFLTTFQPRLQYSYFQHRELMKKHP